MVIDQTFFGVSLVVASIIYAFYKKKDKTALILIIVLLALLMLLSYVNTSISVK